MKQIPWERVRNYLFTFAASALNLVANVLLYRYSLRLLGESGFTDFSIGKRTISLALLVCYPLICTGVSHFVAKEKTDSPRVWLTTNALLVTLVVSPPMLLALGFKSQVTEFLFGSNSSDLLPALLLAFFGHSLSRVVANYMYGRLWFGWGSIVTVISAAVIPLGAVFAAASASEMFWLVGIFRLVLFGAGTLFVRALDSTGELFSRQRMVELARYCLSRVPGYAGLALLLFLPIVLSKELTSDLKIPAILSLAGTFLTLVAAAVAPIATIILPEVTRSVETGQLAQVRMRANRLWLILTVLVGLGIAVGMAAAGPILAWWLREDMANYAYLIVWTLPACLPYAYYLGFSSFLDALDKRGLHSENAAVALVGYGICFVALKSQGWLVAVMGAFFVGMSILGGATVWRTFTRLKPSKSS